MPKLPYLYILIILFKYIFYFNFLFNFYLIFIIIFLNILNIIICVVEGIIDKNLGRIIGQSSMINMSFLFIAIICLSTINEFYLLYIYVFYLIPTILLFSIILLKDLNVDKDFSIFIILSLQNNYFIIFLYFILLSLIGLPFFIGFISKWYIFKLLIEYNFFLLVSLLIFLGIFTSIFYIRLFFFLSFKVRLFIIKINLDNFLPFLFIITLFFFNFSFLILQDLF
jgi:NADH-quinone oxidoreductase subunit N